jgi:hypothetical protein
MEARTISGYMAGKQRTEAKPRFNTAAKYFESG